MSVRFRCLKVVLIAGAVDAEENWSAGQLSGHGFRRFSPQIAAYPQISHFYPQHIASALKRAVHNKLFITQVVIDTVHICRPTCAQVAGNAQRKSDLYTVVRSFLAGYRQVVHNPLAITGEIIGDNLGNGRGRHATPAACVGLAPLLPLRDASGFALAKMAPLACCGLAPLLPHRDTQWRRWCAAGLRPCYPTGMLRTCVLAILRGCMPVLAGAIASACPC